MPSPTPGILYVTMHPASDLPPADFHDWYNNEHGPLRLRLDFVQNGFRYRATDLGGAASSTDMPEWMAIYDCDDMDEFNAPSYMALRGAPVQSQRERDIRPSVTIDRRGYDFVREWKDEGSFKKLEDIVNAGEGNAMVAVRVQPKPGKHDEIKKWYDEEHIDMLAKVGGWRRSRLFVRAGIDGVPDAEKEFLALHEYAPENGLGGPEFIAATSTPWKDQIFAECIANIKRRVYSLYYTFGPAPRDLQNFAAAGFKTWESPATQTKTIPAGGDSGAIESYVTTKDGCELPYRLEGSADPNAPLIVLSNSILAEWGIWDKFVATLLAKKPHFRVLRFHNRGRTAKIGTQPVTMDVLAADIIALLDALRVPKAALVAGVSMGGAAALNTALSYPDRVGAFMACDTNDKSPEGNPKAWKERIEMADKQGATAQSGEKVVGSELAEITTRRWFVKESYDGGAMESECERVKTMVTNNSLEGFRKGVEALWHYDMQAKMKDAKVKGVFVAGAGDGILPKTMKDMAARYGAGADFVAIDGAGHLPMVEKPEQVAEVAVKLLS